MPTTRTLTTFACACLALVFACGAKLAGLNPPTERSYFVLERDVHQASVRGLMKFRWIHGLKQGTYRLVAEDKGGYYYQGEGDAVFLLSQERVDRYLRDGHIPPYLERYQRQASSAGGHGGVWMPRNPAKDKPRIYYILYTTREESIRQGLASMQDASVLPDRTADQPPLTQAVGAALVSVLNGKIEKVDLDTTSIDPAVFKIVKD
jgi:hypothetical protein